MQRKDIYADTVTANIFNCHIQPTEDFHLANKAYVDSEGGGSTYELKYSGISPLLKGEIVRIIPDNITGQSKVVKPSSVPILEQFSTVSASVASKSTATDPLGNVYITGFFSGTATFGDLPPLISAGGSQDIFVAKLNSSGIWQWAVKAGGVGIDVGLGIDVDCSGNAYVTGPFMGNATFGSITLISTSGSPDIFVAKLSPSGIWQWAVKAGGAGIDESYNIAIDCFGNIYVTGSFIGVATFETTPPTTLTSTLNISMISTQDIFVAKLSPSGIWQWAVKAGGANNDVGYDIAIDCFGNVYVTGSFIGVATFETTPPTTLTSTLNISMISTLDIFVAKLNSSGVWQWAVKAGGTGGDEGLGIAADNFGNVYITGYFAETATFGGTTLTSAGNQDIFVSKLNSSGLWQWAVRAGGTSGFSSGNSIDVDCSGNVYITGYFETTSIFGNVTLTPIGAGDAFISKLNSDGGWQWTVQSGEPDYEDGKCITVDNFGNVYVASQGGLNSIFKVSSTILGVAGISKSVTVSDGELATITFPGATGISDFSSSPLLPGHNYYIDNNFQLTNCSKCSQRFLGVAYDETVLLSGVDNGCNC